MLVTPSSHVTDDNDSKDQSGVLERNDRDSEHDLGTLSQHSRTTSDNTLQILEAPISPRNFQSRPLRRNSNLVADNMTEGSRSSWTYGNSYNSDSPRREAFSFPRMRPMTMHSVVQSSFKIERDRTKSTMLTPGTFIPKPWASKRDPYDRISYFLTYAMIILLGFLLGGMRIFFGWGDVILMQGNLCLVMDENFDSDVGMFGPDGKFFREVEMSGFGNGQFEMTTSSENNSYVKNGHLYITPTLTSDVIGEAAILDGYIYNITDCTYNITNGVTYTSPKTSNSGLPSSDQAVQAYLQACSAVSNSTSGSLINPVQSARLSTRYSANIQYGKVEVRAKNPTGDWLWPAIWMLPSANKYGQWPMSGEIDLMESRGNRPSYPHQGSDFVSGSLNWGPLGWLNAGWKTFGWWWVRRNGFDKGFHTYTLEWDEDFIRIYVDTRLHHMLDLKIKSSFFELGQFPTVVENATDTLVLENPWINGTKAAPFDQSFYLILDVAVGGTDGWFPDGEEKPWLDGSRTPGLDFWRARDQWGPTWPVDADARSLVIDYVKMWQMC